MAKAKKHEDEELEAPLEAVAEGTLNEPEPVPEKKPEPFKLDIKNLDFALFMKFCWAMGMSNHSGYVGLPGVRRIGQMLGAKTHAEELEIWQQVKTFMLKKQAEG
jgi:hypothetical protein